jgi:hypothetical protein
MTTYIVDESGVVQFFGPRTSPTKSKANEQALSYVPARCPSCKALMPLRKLRNHTIVAHGYGAMPAIEPTRMKPLGAAPSHVGDTTGRRPSPDRPAGRSSSVGADPMDGSRGIGHFAREGGRFGSMPTYDDYGEQGLA